MASLDKYIPHLLSLEGGLVNNPYDKGALTNMGVTLAVWLANGWDKDGDGDIDAMDLRKITTDDVKRIAKKLYWDKIGGDYINSQSVAEFLFDWAYNSGPTKAVRKVQALLEGIKVDGVMGPKTIEAINMNHPQALFESLKDSRRDFYNAIVRANPSQKVFLRGWMKRVDSFKFHD